MAWDIKGVSDLNAFVYVSMLSTWQSEWERKWGGREKNGRRKKNGKKGKYGGKKGKYGGKQQQSF